MNLTEKKCVACEGSVPPLAGALLEKYLGEVNSPDAGVGVKWTLIEGEKKIRREYSFPDFAQALAFVNKVGAIAESEGHHPEIRLGWGKVVVELSTHAIGGLSENDFILAAKVDHAN